MPASTPSVAEGSPAAVPTKRLFGSQSVAAPPSANAGSTSGEVYHPTSAHVTSPVASNQRPQKLPARLMITADVANGWHIYALAAKDPKDVSKPTLIVLTKPAGQPFPLGESGFRADSRGDDRKSVGRSSISQKQSDVDRRFASLAPIHRRENIDRGNHRLSNVAMNRAAIALKQRRLRGR